MRRRIAWLVVAVTALVTVAFVVPLALLVQRQAADRAQVRLERQVEERAALVALSSAGGTVDVATLANLLPAGIGAVLPDGAVIGDVDPKWDPVASAMIGRSASSGYRDRWVVALPVSTADGYLAVVGSIPSSELSKGVGRSVVLLLAVGLMVNAAAVLLSLRLGRTVTEPINRLATAAHRFAEGDLEYRVEPDGPEEVQEVGRALNQLAGRLDEIIAGEREAMADLSHRLRTPLAGLRLQADQVGDPAVRASLHDQLDRMQRSVDELIGAMREGRRREAICDLSEVVAHRLEFWKVLADEEDRPVTADLADRPVRISATAEEAGAVVDTLIGNVFSHTDPGVGYRVELGLDDGMAVLTVADRGPGFPPGVDPVARGTSGAGSSGLGLDIARRLAERCGGAIETWSDDGAGVRLSFRTV